MAGIHHRARFGVGPQGVAAKQLREDRVVGHGRVKIKQCHGRRAGHHHAWRVDGLGQDVGRKPVAQASKAVVEGQFVEGFQWPSPT